MGIIALEGCEESMRDWVRGIAGKGCWRLEVFDGSLWIVN
jgi:hypothetical protein